MVTAGLGDEWGHRIVNTTNREKELGSQILQVSLRAFSCKHTSALQVGHKNMPFFM